VTCIDGRLHCVQIVDIAACSGHVNVDIMTAALTVLLLLFKVSTSVPGNGTLNVIATATC